MYLVKTTIRLTRLAALLGPGKPGSASGVSAVFCIGWLTISISFLTVDAYSQETQLSSEPNNSEGACALYPGWGATRVFSLRGF